jgi:hypothetical protein
MMLSGERFALHIKLQANLQIIKLDYSLICFIHFYNIHLSFACSYVK